MSADLDQLIERYHRALGEFMTGNSEPAMAFYSQRDDITLGNPFGPVARGPNQVKAAAGQAAKHYRDGGAVGFDTIAKYETPELAYLVEVERYKAKVGGRDDVTSVALRVTSIFRRENDGWKLLHRHADPITAVQPAESVVRK